jgi:DNA-binding transcriptional ArsR family regulator
VLRRLSARSEADRSALVVYFLLAAFRDVKIGATTLSYDKIQEYLGLSREQISQTISHLAELGMVRVRSGRDRTDPSIWGPNHYYLIGLDERGRNEVGGSDSTEKNGLDRAS